MKLILYFTVLSIGLSAQPHLALEQTINRKVDSVLALMTLEEKFGQLNQLGGHGDKITDEQRDLLKKGLVGSFLNVNGAEATKKVQKIAVEETRLGIPLIFGYDVIHGYRTIFPVPLAEASTWDPDLVEQAARVAAREASASGLHWTFAPMVDIARDPRWGRIVEGSGEDPFLGSAMAAARVRGFQGKSLNDPGSIMACAKHYVAYGGAEAGRDYNTVDISERTLREIYLPPFHAAVNAGVGSLMSAFNEIGGIPASSNRLTLSQILRDEWNFKGMVVSDWTSILELVKHGVAGSRPEAGVLSLQAGVDMDMEGRIYLLDLFHALKDGRILLEQVDRSVKRVLRMKFLLGLFSDPYRNCDTETEKQTILHPDHRAMARSVAQKSIVLLKNDKNILPLKKDLKSILVVGPLAESKSDPLGSGHGKGMAEDVVTVLDGIKRAVSAQSKVLYAKGSGIDSIDKRELQKARQMASRADVVLVVAGETARMSGEAASRAELGIPTAQHELIKAMQATGKPVVLVLMNGRPLAIPWEAGNISAILDIWFLGVEAGNAVADVLFGEVNPSGKLPVTFPRTVGQVPIYYNHKNTGRPPSKDYYTSKYLDVPVTPEFPFGFGLSYSTFAYSDFAAASSIGPNESLKVSVTIQNTGNRKGDEVVQLYIRDVVGSVTRPVKELKGFRRISLGPGEKKKVDFLLTSDMLWLYNAKMERVTEPGEFVVFVGGNSVDLLEKSFVLRAQ
ncbi:MAG: beta-glucosidase BglX [Ignavibacteriales bacterium]|nr:beta-glucosidase BglX [Ignavibacteriales bacterium]